MQTDPRLCPRCGMKMVAGHLASSWGKVFIESEQSQDDSSLQALICTDCGHVELQAVCPDALAHHNFPDAELGDEFFEQEEP